jgi:aminopeptidase N
MTINSFSRKCLIFPILVLAACGGSKIGVKNGVSLELAQYRAASLSNINYKLWFGIPSDADQSIDGSVTIEFDLSDAGDALQLDFRESPDRVASVVVNGRKSQFRFASEHIVIPVEELKVGHNAIDIRFIAGDSSLNRNPEYLYTLFVPDRARTAFPLFDQPDLKATFELTLEFPRGWTAISNAPIAELIVSEHDSHPEGRVFERSDLIPSYLFSFVAGKFESETGGTKAIGNSSRRMTMLHRETDAEKWRVTWRRFSGCIRLLLSGSKVTAAFLILSQSSILH